MPDRTSGEIRRSVPHLVMLSSARQDGNNVNYAQASCRRQSRSGITNCQRVSQSDSATMRDCDFNSSHFYNTGCNCQSLCLQRQAFPLMPCRNLITSRCIRQNRLAVGLTADSAFSFTAQQQAPALVGAVIYGRAVDSGVAGQ